MTQSVAEIAYQGGRSIAEARTPAQLDHALTPLLELPAYPPDVEHLDQQWQKASARDSFFILRVAQEASISIGTGALVLARFDPQQSIVDQTVESIDQFRRGLRHGGIGRGTVRAIIGRALQEMTVECYQAGGYAPLAAGRLELIGRTAKVFGWRERLDITAAKAAHVQRHGMSAGTFDRLTQTLAKQVAQTRNSA